MFVRESAAVRLLLHDLASFMFLNGHPFWTSVKRLSNAGSSRSGTVLALELKESKCEGDPEG